MTTRVRGKAHEALNEALEWIEASKEEVREREAALALAQQQLHMHETIYAVLEKTLTRQPRQKSATKTSKKSAAKASSKKRAGLPRQEAHCMYVMSDGLLCNNDEHSPIHNKDGGYGGCHLFVAASTRPESAKAAVAGGGDGSDDIS